MLQVGMRGVFGDVLGPARYKHGPLPELWQAKVITEGSSAPHVASREIVLDRRLMNSPDYYTDSGELMVYLFVYLYKAIPLK